MPIEIRPTAPDELRAAASAVRVALLDAPPDDDAWAKVAASWLEQRSFSAWDGGRCVGHVASFDVDTTIPGGGALPTAAITRAGVLPTHRRRGVFRALMDAVLDDARERGVVLASLRASEATIYPHFGFGIAGTACAATIDVARARPLSGATTDGTFEIVPREEIHATVAPIYASAAGRPGRISRPRWVMERYFEDAVVPSKEVVVVHRSSTGEADGYAHYETTWTDDTLGLDIGQGTIHEVIGANPGVELALWNFLLDLTPVRSYRAAELPTDSVLFAAANDVRAVRFTDRWDEQWLRILDVGAALTARRYAAGPGVSIAVTDAGLSVGAWRIGDDGAVPSDADSADVTCDVAALSAAYLGSTSWWELVASGRAQAASPTAIEVADARFAHRPLAFCGSFF